MSGSPLRLFEIDHSTTERSNIVNITVKDQTYTITRVFGAKVQTIDLTESQISILASFLQLLNEKIMSEQGS